MGIYEEFIGGVKDSGLTNPYGLAAVAATGKRESGYDPANAFGTWSDPAQSGGAGTAGGIMSWRNERLAKLRQFAAEAGDNPDAPSPTTQAKFFAAEDPTLVQKLNGAQSVEAAQGLMNNAWRFAGFDKPGGEAAARTETARSYFSDMTGDTPSDPAIISQRGSDATLSGSAGQDKLGSDPINGKVGALGGLGGYLNSEGAGDVMQALGYSLLSSPNNAPLRGLPEYLPALQDRREKKNERQTQQQALTAALRKAGLSPDEAAAYSTSPTAASVAVSAQEYQAKLARAQAAQEADRRFALDLTSPDVVGAPDAATGVAAPVVPIATAPSVTTDPTNPAAPATPAIPGLPAAATTAAPAAPTEFGTGNRTVDSLMSQRARIATKLAEAPSDEAFQRGKVQLDQVDKQIEQYSPTSDIKEYTFAMSQRQNEGLPHVSYDQWKSEHASGTSIESDGKGGFKMVQGPGAKGKSGPTESELRNAQLYTVITPEIDTVNQTFDKMGTLTGAAADNLPVAGEYMQTEGYQRGRNALKTIIKSYLYSVSGASATDAETDSQADLLMPKPGEREGSLRDKRARIDVMAKAIRIAAGKAIPEDAEPGVVPPPPASGGEERWIRVDGKLQRAP